MTILGPTARTVPGAGPYRVGDGAECLGGVALGAAATIVFPVGGGAHLQHQRISPRNVVPCRVASAARAMAEQLGAMPQFGQQ